MREQVASLDPTLPVEAGTLQESVSKLADQPRFEMLLVSYFACTGLILASLGLYGVTSFLMMQRKAEIGIRMALGASKRDVVRLVLGSAIRMVLPGTVAGLILSCSLSRVLSGLLYKVGPHDVASFFCSTALLMTVAIVASLIPAIAATRVDPNATLRAD